MRVSREQAAENREKILDTAAQMFREKGFDGIGLADLMKSAGLTHGGFYGHFSSKEDLMAQACTRAVDQLLEEGQARRVAQEGEPFAMFVEHYLSSAHRDNPGAGCIMLALGADVTRQSLPVRKAFTQGAKRLLGGLARLIGGENPAESAYEKAILTLASLIGAQVMARAVDDEALSQEVLRVVRQNTQLH
jgi:TetR/AcrR family transcriptional repressor of nem operon